MSYNAYLVRTFKPPLKDAVVVSAYGWGGGAVRQAGEILGPTGIEIVGTVEVHGAPDADIEAKAATFADDLAARIRGCGSAHRPHSGAFWWVRGPKE